MDNGQQGKTLCDEMTKADAMNRFARQNNIAGDFIGTGADQAEKSQPQPGEIQQRLQELLMQLDSLDSRLVNLVKKMDLVLSPEGVQNTAAVKTERPCLTQLGGGLDTAIRKVNTLCQYIGQVHQRIEL